MLHSRALHAVITLSVARLYISLLGMQVSSMLLYLLCSGWKTIPVPSQTGWQAAAAASRSLRESPRSPGGSLATLNLHWSRR